MILTFECFLNAAKQKYNNKFDYSEAKFVDNNTKIKIICKNHGIFETSPINHLKMKYGCKNCAIDYQRNSVIKFNVNRTRIMTKDDVIRTSNLKYHNVYNYNLLDKLTYTYADKIKIFCYKHGIFERNIRFHLAGKGCPKCKRTEIYKKHSEKFFEKVKKKHGDKYDYSLVKYTHIRDKIKIICHKHGIFVQDAFNHANGSDCPKCASFGSKAEKELGDFLKNIYTDTIIEKNRKILKNYLELDFYIPKLKIAFEYNGTYWHNERYIDKNYHLNKTEQCEQKGIQLIHIYEYDWHIKKNIILSYIKFLLNKNKIYVITNIYIEEISNELKDCFLQNNCLYNTKSTINIGLFDDNKILIAIMTFIKMEENVFIFSTFCTLSNYFIKNAHIELFKYFLYKYNPKKIYASVDRSWHTTANNNIYTDLHFKFICKSEPNCKEILIYRQRRKVTEILKIYDSGNIEYIWEKQ